MSHGFYIWGAYGVSLVALALEVVFLARRTRNCSRQADKMPK